MLESIRYNILFKQFKNKIYSYAIFILKNEMDADDVTQEVLIRVWKNMGKFNINAAGVWIMRTAHNLCMDYLRSRKRYVNKTLNINDDMEELIPDNSPENLPDHKANYINVSVKINDAIKNLPETLNSIFVLYEIQGFKYKEISDVLNLPINTVKVYLLRARKKLQQDLKEYEKEKVY